jgi:hypothetical protein
LKISKGVIISLKSKKGHQYDGLKGTKRQPIVDKTLQKITDKATRTSLDVSFECFNYAIQSDKLLQLVSIQISFSRSKRFLSIESYMDDNERR